MIDLVDLMGRKQRRDDEKLMRMMRGCSGVGTDVGMGAVLVTLGHHDPEW